ncbi:MULTISPECIES: hypothetical protein [unclassified Pseudomonas]|uniref:hypothetical protein n=1 Tax=unclassified Pseudomonas TaxID=196821 RepID=UPI002AC8E320|nr:MULTISPECIES: hypothetical protein [unclassified Pseudomonas]MEB0040461.1 hypothetical protein [Pseudomonas sp. MH10]MEB0121286.1 hypothetical protein [Pseudomonas sp. CCI1.2]WPX66151.1 hypothetical protein RHM59_11145 [Pseudomonas sp. MH10]
MSLFQMPPALYFRRTYLALASKKVLKMSSGMGIASIFVLSSFLLSAQASAEESQSFAAQNAARHASIEKSQAEMTAKIPSKEQTQEKSVERDNSDTTRKS